MKGLKGQLGFNLVELMIVMGISAFLMSGVSVLLVRSKTTTQKTDLQFDTEQVHTLNSHLTRTKKFWTQALDSNPEFNLALRCFSRKGHGCASLPGPLKALASARIESATACGGNCRATSLVRYRYACYSDEVCSGLEAEVRTRLEPLSPGASIPALQDRVTTNFIPGYIFSERSLLDFLCVGSNFPPNLVTGIDWTKLTGLCEMSDLAANCPPSQGPMLALSSNVPSCQKLADVKCAAGMKKFGMYDSQPECGPQTNPNPILPPPPPPLLPQNGVCGSANNGKFQAPPNINLCDAGVPGPLVGDGPWSWVCKGINGGADSAVCQALFEKPGPGNGKDKCPDSRPISWAGGRMSTKLEPNPGGTFYGNSLWCYYEVWKDGDLFCAAYDPISENQKEGKCCNGWGTDGKMSAKYGADCKGFYPCGVNSCNYGLVMTGAVLVPDPNRPGEQYPSTFNCQGIHGDVFNCTGEPSPPPPGGN